MNNRAILSLAVPFLLLAQAALPAAAMTDPMKAKKAQEKKGLKVSVKLDLAADDLEDDEDEFQEAGGIIKFGEDVTIAEGEEVNGLVLVFGGSIKVDGEVDGPVVAFGGSTTLGPKAVINGPAVSIGGKTLRAQGSRVNGPIVDTPGGPLFSGLAAALASLAAGAAGLYLLVKASLGIGWVVLALALVALFPEPLKRTQKLLGAKPVDSFLVGLMVWPVGAVVSMTLLISLIGIPLLPFLAAIAAAAYVWGFAAMAYWTGERLAHGRWKNNLLSVVVGMIILKLLQWIPIVKWFVLMAGCSFGVGAAVLSGFGVKELFGRSSRPAQQG